MNKLLLKSIAVATLLWGTSHTADTIFDHMQQYAVDSKVAAVLDQHCSSLGKKLRAIDKNGGQHGVWQFQWLPGYYVKYGLSRIWGMELMQQAIEEYNLDLLELPDKRIYHLKNKPYQVNNVNYCVVIKKVKTAHHSKKMSLEQMKQLCTLIHATKYISPHRANYIYTGNGKICLIDTESNYDVQNEVKAYLRLLGYGHNLNKDFSEEALKYLFYTMKKLLDKESDHDKIRQTVSLAKGYVKAHKPQSWDYVHYFNEYFAEYL